MPEKTIDVRYPMFIGVASVEAYKQLDVLLEKWNAEATDEIVKDAAQIGFKKAMERVFPGLPRHPFSRNPIDDIVVALRYYYQLDPDSQGGRMLDDTEERTSKRIAGVPHVSRASQTAVHTKLTGDSSHPGMAGTAAGSGKASPYSDTNLKKIGPAPVFPWEKIQKKNS